MKSQSQRFVRRELGRVSIDTKGANGPDIEMIGLWHKPALTK